VRARSKKPAAAEKPTASFLEPMLCLSSSSLPEGDEWQYELKLDGYRALAIKTAGKIQLRSRNDKDFVARYPAIAEALRKLPGETIIDGELVAFDETNRPSFNALQNYASSTLPIYFYAFDLVMLSGRDLQPQPLEKRRELLQSKVLTRLKEPVRFSPTLTAPLNDLITSVQQQRFEGLIAKRKDSRYESGQRTGAWLKMRVNQGQEFVIGGYTPSPRNFDALVFGYYESDKLIFVAKTRNGFTPSLRESLFRQFEGLGTETCPFANLPERRTGRWGQGLTAAKMKDCRWLRPVLVGQFEYTEWTPENHLRHSRFVALRDDKKPRDVRREMPSRSDGR
jgi:DNA ligase D-like protein (predicted ligase)